MLSCGIKHNNLMLVQLEMITIYLLIYISGYCQYKTFVANFFKLILRQERIYPYLLWNFEISS